jgi:cellulose synthase/poly-beta-1,6-N-acetylglucosamine synthase-like glycosyltransferase
MAVTLEGFWIGVALAMQGVATAYFCIFGAYCYVLVWLHARRKKTMLAQDAAVLAAWRPADHEIPVVTVQLPVFNERYVVGRLIESVVRLDYPRDRLEIQVLDDSTDETTQIARDLADRYRQEGVDIKVLHRTDRSGYKAGALAEGTEVARGEFIAIFDADFVPPADFLRKTVPFMQDPKVAVVQTLWGHLNADYSKMTIAQSVALDGINYVMQSVQSWYGLLPHFQGTAGIWRKAAIADSGGWQSDCLTEDLDLSFRAQICGWTVKYLPQVLCPGELPATISATKTQQHRWAKGGYQVMQKLLPSILRTNAPWYAKLEVAFYMMSLVLQPCLLLLALGWPAQNWLREQAPLSENLLPASIILLFGLFGPTTLFLYTQRELYPDWKRRIHHYFYLMVWAPAVAANNTKGILEAVFRIKSGFVRTPKFRIERQSDSFIGKAYTSKLNGQVLVEALITVYCLFGIFYMVFLQPEPVIDPFLMLFSSGMCLGLTMTIWEPIAQYRAQRRTAGQERPPAPDVEPSPGVVD